MLTTDFATQITWIFEKQILQWHCTTCSRSQQARNIQALGTGS